MPPLDGLESIEDDIQAYDAATGGNQGPRGFQFPADKFPRVSPAKLKERIFVGPQIREVLKDEDFDKVSMQQN